VTDREPIETKNLDRYGSAPLPWSRAREQLMAEPDPGVPWFLGTGRPDGSLHAAGVGCVWFDGDLYFTSNADTRKSRNLAADPACTISVRLPGIDLVLEGSSTVVTDQPTLEEVAEVFRSGGWQAEVAGGAFTAPFSAPSAGPPPWQLYRFTFHTAFGVATAEPHGATRWRFKD
jgi:pyridoxamine 5'-phosphate oxidase-like protein